VIFQGPSTPDLVNLHWLKSEWWKLPPEHQSSLRYLIDEADQNDVDQNAARAQIMRAVRGRIIDEIPPGSRYQEVRIEEDDLPKMFIITSWDWFLDTGRSFALTETEQHLRSGRGGLIGGQDRFDHRRLVEEKVPYIQDYDAKRSDEHLILIATEESGPYTIIDGTHRATALLQEHRRSPNMPWKAVLIDSPGMSANHWHIGFDDVSRQVADLDELARRGDIW
jgi:hypothetical protein